jgi:hypothetical protein
MTLTVEEEIAKRYPECTLDHYDTHGESIDVYLISNVTEGICPVCGALSNSLSARYVKNIADIALDNRFCTVHLTIRNLTCRGACNRKAFFSTKHSFLADPGARKTDRLIKRILKVASKYPVRTAVTVLQKEHIKCDKNTISRLLKDNHMRKCDLAK